MGVGGIGKNFMQQMSEAGGIAKDAIQARTKTLRSISESITYAKDVDTKLSSVFKLTAAVTGAIIGTALKPFAFNPEKAKEELRTLTTLRLPESPEDLKQLRSDIRWIKQNLNYVNERQRSDFQSRLTQLLSLQNQTLDQKAIHNLSEDVSKTLVKHFPGM